MLIGVHFKNSMLIKIIIVVFSDLFNVKNVKILLLQVIGKQKNKKCILNNSLITNKQNI